MLSPNYPHLRETGDAVWNVVPRRTVNYKAILQMMLQRPYAYCVYVKVYPSIFEHNLELFWGGKIFKNNLVSQKVRLFHNL